jgi:DNA-binding transcriptional ArsR family regulator
MAVTKNDFKQVVYQEISKTLAACSDPRRLEILDLLAQCERNVETLASMLGVGLTTTSHHLQLLKQARLVHTRKVGRYVYYSATEWRSPSGTASPSSPQRSWRWSSAR